MKRLAVLLLARDRGLIREEEIGAEKPVLGINEEIPLGRVVDFGTLHEVLAELGVAPAPDAAR